MLASTCEFMIFAIEMVLLVDVGQNVTVYVTYVSTPAPQTPIP